MGGDGWPIGKPAVGNKAKGTPGRGGSSKGFNNFKNKAVIATNPVTQENFYFFSAQEAKRTLPGIQSGHIAACCKGKRKTHGGYIWRYSTNL